MNAILSFIVCIALVLSPAGVLPAQPETATTWTISNLTIGVGEESVTLAPEARLTTAIGMDEAQLHFELGSGEKTLMPMSGAINADGVRFTLGTGTRTYTLSNETFMQLTGMDEQDAQMLDVFGDFFLGYGKILAMAKNEEKYAELNAVSGSMIEAMFGTGFEETEVEVDGKMMPAIQVQGELTLGGVMNMLDVIADCGIAEMEEFMDAAMKLVNLMLPEPVEKFSDLAAQMEEEDMNETAMTMDVVYVTEDPMFSRVNMTADMDGDTMVIQAESFIRGEETTMHMVMEMGNEAMTMDYDIDASYTGPYTAPTSMTVEYDVRSENDYSYSFEAEDGSPVNYTSKDSMVMNMSLQSEIVDGLGTGSLEVVANNTSTYGYDGETDTYEENMRMDMDYSERFEEDGSITGSYMMDINALDENVQLSFDVNRAQGAVPDYFADTKEQALSADTEDAGYNVLMADCMGVAADAVVLTADESVIALVDMFERLAGVDYEEEYEDYDDEEYEAPEASVVYTFEDAAEIYDGYIPDYTAPEGYALKEITVEGYSMYAIYESAETGDEFELCSFLYTSDTGASYYTLKDGTLTAVDDPIVEFTVYGDVVGNADVFTPEGTVTFYFRGQETAEAEAIVAGIK